MKNNTKTIRLAHLLSQRGVASRRAAEGIIADGEVKVHGVVVTDPAFPVNPEDNDIVVAGNPLPVQVAHRYIALNKPPGFLSNFTKSNENGRLLGELITLEERLFVAGRLDLASHGLLIITTDGEWANHVMHPRYEKEKEYLVRFRGAKVREAVKRLAAVTFTEKGKKFRAVAVRADGLNVRVILKEGRNRQIRRLAEKAELRIKDLARIRIGSIQLGRLKEGHWRKLNQKEIKDFL
ncbi:MAG: pseudouridine synthase [Candidatus Electryonea clarkiae]|nr:pseudouridine synthase [Candidatus Electryonea clarkiae]MDP8286746.1 pseudouridine synthase [Candidatus Electryonea clarkiae]